MEWAQIQIGEGETLGYVVLRYFALPFALLLIGGIAANILYPRWQDRYLRRKAAAEHRARHGEDVVAIMNQYVVNWRRLIDCATYARACLTEMEGDLDKDRLADLTQELERRQANVTEAAKARNSARDDLLSSMSRFSLYCTQKDQEFFRSFIEWDEAQSLKRLDDLPPIQEWRTWENRILKVVSSALS